MVANAIVLDSDENFIEFLDPNLLDIKYTNEEYGIKTVSITYYVKGIEDYKNLFKIGNKIYVPTDGYIPNVLYIINTPVENDLFKENNVVFDAEEKLVELNHAFFSQTSIASATGIVNINYASLFDFFGDYFQIGIIQRCLSPYMEKVIPTGTMTLMELLRFIEEETGNVFVTQYEKDVKNNDIHCFLNFLNPKSTSKQWELHLFYRFPTDGDHESSTPDVVADDIFEKDDIVNFPTYVAETPLVPANIKFRLKSENELLFEDDATTLGFTNSGEYYEFIFNYTVNNLDLSVKRYVLDPQTGDFVVDNTELTSHEVTIPNGTVFEMYDTSQDMVVYAHTLYPKLGDVHEEILDLGFNTENITYETDESDTYVAIAPVIGNSDLTYAQLNQVIQNWIELEVTKGDIVPMIVQKRNITGTDQDPVTSIEDALDILGDFDVSENYYARPVKANDSTDQTNKSFEFYVATAYWNAPFTKIGGSNGELFVADDDITGVEYTHIQGNRDNIDESAFVSTPKTGGVETSDEDPYAIFNDVCMKLKDKRYPEIKIELDVANLVNGEFNNYEVFDQVYIKIPGIEKMIIATVSKVEKNPLDIGENKIELTNFTVNKKVAQKQTEITATNMSYMYPANKTLSVRLVNNEYDSDDPDSIEFIPDRLITFAIFSVENETETITSMIYTKKTDNNGYASINLNLVPGNYIVEATFGGDTEYAATSNRVKVNVGGVIETPTPATKTITVKERRTVNTYYTKYGVSPDGKLIAAIGKKSSGNTFYLTIFERKCPYCGSKNLFWSIYWAGNETKKAGIFPATGHRESGSTKGRIFCKKCEKGWDCLGQPIDGSKKLKVKHKAKKSSKAKAYELKKGQKKYGTTVVEVEVQKVVGNTGTPIDRGSGNTGTGYSGLVSETVKKKAKSIAGNSTGIAAAKKIAKWVGKHIKHEKREGFYQSPATTLKRKKGNCCCQTDLFLQMLDATGVCKKYTCQYIHVGTMKYGKRHFFARVNGIDVDCDAKKANCWGHASYKGRTIYSRNTYPKLPINRKYKG